MIDLSNVEQIKKLDPKDVYGSTGMLASQCKQIWTEAKNLQFPDTYRKIEHIVICGMGGSAYGGHIVKELFKENITLPLYINSDYTLPGFVNENSLIVLTSYSGSTEETVRNGKHAQERGAKIAGITSGGTLAEFLRDGAYPNLTFTPSYNPSGQPRLGTGYIILGTIGLLHQLGVLTVIDQMMQDAIEELEKSQEEIKQIAMQTAKALQGRIPVLFAAEFLEGNAHILRNQFNETSKSFSTFSELPELNHHLLEGFKNPEDKKLSVIMLNSSLYSDIIKKRISLTQDVLQKNTIPLIPFDAKGTNVISHMLSTLSFGSYVSVYLAFLYGLDPSLIPWVDYFKAELAK